MTMQHIIRQFFDRIAKDLKQKELIPLKILFFIHASTLLVLYPYLTLHMRELGINVEETAIMSAVTPAIGIIMPPLAGMVADKIGNFKLLLCIFSTLGGFASLLLLLVPVGRITVTYPTEVLSVIGCQQSGDFVMGMTEDIPCDVTLNNPSVLFNATIESCGFICEIEESYRDIPEMLITPENSEVFNNPEVSLRGAPTISDLIPEADDTVYVTQIFKRNDSFQNNDIDPRTINPVRKATSYKLIIKIDGHESSFIYNLTESDRIEKTNTECLEHRTMHHNKNYKTAIRRISKDLYYLPASTYDLECALEDETGEYSDFLLSSRFSRLKREAKPSICTILHNLQNTFSDIDALYPMGTVNLALEKLQMDKINRPFSLSDTYRIDVLEWNDTHVNPTCSVFREEVSANVYLPDDAKNSKDEVMFPICEPRCLLTSNRTKVCSNLKKEIEFDPVLTFWSYMIVRVFIGIIGGTAFAMFEGAVIAILREQQADYGLQRIYAAIGGMISSPLSGFLIDHFSEGKGYRDYRPAFYLYASLKLLGGILILMISLEFKKGAQTVVADVISVLKKIEALALLLSCFILGTAWGYIESFLFWLLQDMGGSSSLMGITYTVGGLAGIPLLALSGPIINKIGHANVIFLGFIFYSIRLIGYSLIYNPWHSLFFEAMESITTSLSFTAAVTYAAKLSTTTTDSSIQGLLGGLYFGVGKGAGSLVGGFLMKRFSTRPTFQIFAVFTFFMGCVYFLFNQFYMRHRQEEGNEICKKQEKPKEHVTLTVINNDKYNSHDGDNNNSNNKTGQDNLAFENEK